MSPSTERVTQMKTTKTEIKLTANNPTAERFLAVMGNTVIREDTIWGDGDIDSDYHFNSDTGNTVGWVGDDSIGACVGLMMDGDELIATFDFGDEGRYTVEVNESNQFLVIGDL